MTSDELLTLGSFALAAIGTVSVLIWRVRQVDQRHTDQIASVEKELHRRINKVRDEYARKDDLFSQLHRIDLEVSELRRESSNTNQMLGQLLTIAKQSK